GSRERQRRVHPDPSLTLRARKEGRLPCSSLRGYTDPVRPPGAGRGAMTPRCLFTPEQLAARVAELAAQVSADYAGRCPVLVGVLKGGWVFLADLVRRLAAPVRVDFVKLSSYGAGTHSSGQLRLDLRPTLPVAAEDVLGVR